MSTANEERSLDTPNGHKEKIKPHSEAHSSLSPGEVGDGQPCDIFVHLHSSKCSDEEIINTFNMQMEKHGVMETKVECHADRPGDRLVIISFQDRSNMHNFRRNIYDGKEKIMLDGRPVFFDFNGRYGRDFNPRRFHGRPRSPPMPPPPRPDSRPNSRYHRYIEMRDLEGSRRDFHHQEPANQYPRRRERYVRLERENHSERGGAPADTFSENRTLFVGNVDQEVTEEDMTKVFERYGSILDIILKKPNHPNQLPYCFVKYKSQDSALAARNALNMNFIGKSRVKIGFGKVAPSSILWFGAENESVDTEELLPLIRRYANLMDMECSPSKSHCYVSFRSVKDAIDVHRRLNGARFARSKARIQVDFADTECEAKSLKKIAKSRERSTSDRSATKDDKRDDRSLSSSTSVSRESSPGSDRRKRSVSRARSESRSLSSSRSGSYCSSNSDSELSRTYRSSSEDEEPPKKKKSKKKKKKDKWEKSSKKHKESCAHEDNKKSHGAYRNDIIEDDQIEDIEPLYSSDPDETEVYAHCDNKRNTKYNHDQDEDARRNQNVKRHPTLVQSTSSRGIEKSSLISSLDAGSWRDSTINESGRKRKVYEQEEDIPRDFNPKKIKRDSEISQSLRGGNDYISHSNVPQSPSSRNPTSHYRDRFSASLDVSRGYEREAISTPKLKYEINEHSKPASDLISYLREFPIAWSGSLVVKNNLFACNMHLIAGNVRFVSKIEQAACKDAAAGIKPNGSCLKISKRFSTMTDKLQALRAETESPHPIKNYCILLAVPVHETPDHLSVVAHTSSLADKSFGELLKYFAEKKAAGLLKLDEELSMYLITPSSFTEQLFAQFTECGSSALHMLRTQSHMMIILAK